MFHRFRSPIIVALCLSVAGTVFAVDCGSVRGTNTVDVLFRPSSQGERVNFTVTTTGASPRQMNRLTVKVQQMTRFGFWVTLFERRVRPGSTMTGSYTVRNLFSSGTGEMVRYRLSRKLFTKRIDWCLSE